MPEIQTPQPAAPPPMAVAPQQMPIDPRLLGYLPQSAQGVPGYVWAFGITIVSGVLLVVGYTLYQFKKKGPLGFLGLPTFNLPDE